MNVEYFPPAVTLPYSNENVYSTEGQYRYLPPGEKKSDEFTEGD